VGDVVHQRSGSGLFFGIPGMHFPPHSLFWLLVTTQQQRARFRGGPSAKLRGVWLSSDTQLSFQCCPEGSTLERLRRSPSGALLLLSSETCRAAVAGLTAGPTLQGCGKGSAAGGWTYKEGVSYNEKLRVGWQWVEILALLSLGK